MKRFLLYTMLCVSFLTLEAQTITWTGAGDGTNWEDGNNWDLLTVPSISNDVIVLEGDVLTGGNTISINEHAYAKSLTINSHNTLNIYHNITFRDESLFDYFTNINCYEGGFESGETGPDAHISALTNKGFIYIHSAPTYLGYCVLNNEGNLAILSSGALSLLTRSEINNFPAGRITVQGESDILPMIPVPGYYTIGTLNNYGTIERTIGNGSADIMVPVNNYGTIESKIGVTKFINFDLNNKVDGIIKGTNTIELPETADFINNGTFEPGSSPGTLTVIGDFESSASSKLAVELNGYLQGSDYDLLNIQGNAKFSGYVNILLDFEPSINDEFIVATTTGTIMQCNLESTANAAYGGNVYQFSVTCQNNKEVLLKLINIESGQTITWTGNGDSTNWNDPYNWDVLAVPTKDNDVIIPDGSTLTINNHAQTKSITVQGNTVMTLNDGITFSDPSLFEENVTINWHLGALKNYWPNYGVALTNKGTININRLIPSFQAPQFYGPTVNNEGDINLINGSLIIVGSIINNLETGIIDILSDDSGIGGGIDGNGTLNNYGNIKKSMGTGESRICSTIVNMGTIEILIGELYLCDNSSISFNNTTEGTIKGAGVFNISQLASYSNSGTFEPGTSPGTLTFIGDFTSTATSNLVIEIDGKSQGTEYDLLAIQGNAIFNGVIDVTMGYNGSLFDEFIVATATGNMTECNLASVATTEYDGNLYDFTVECRNNNEVVLTLANITLGIDSNEFSNSSISLFPNPVYNDFTLRNNSNQNLQTAMLIDLNGRVIKEIDLTDIKKDKIISLQNYATGLYLIKLNTENNTITKKIVKL